MNSKEITIGNVQKSKRRRKFENRGLRQRKARQKQFAKYSLIVLALLILLIVLLCKGCNDQDTNLELVGVWRYDAYTEYEFKDGHSGCLCLDGNTHYEFTYHLEDDVLYIDFLLEYVNDCQYTYVLQGDNLTLVGGEGTAEVGNVYELMKVK